MSLWFKRSQAWMHGRLIMIVPTTAIAVLSMFLTTNPSWARSHWTQVSSLPDDRMDLAAGELNGALYAIAGAAASETTNVFRYDGTNWTDVLGLPGARDGLAAGVLNGALYAIGGNDGSADKTNVFCYNGTNWTEVNGLPAAREKLAAGVLNGALYAVGGKMSSVKNNVYRFDGTNWTEVSSLPEAREHLAVGGVNGALYAVGGDYGSAAKTNVFRYDGTNWTEVMGLPSARDKLAAGVLNGSLYAVGGEGTYLGGDSKTNVYRFDGTNWTEMEGLPAPRRSLAVGTLNGSLYAIAGYPAVGGVQDTVYRFDEERGLQLSGTNGAIIASGEAVSAEKGSDFGAMSWGTVRTNVFSMVNTGDVPLTVSAVLTNGTGATAFQVNNAVGAIGPYGTSYVNVVFTPASVQAYTAQVSFANNGPTTSYVLNLAGAGEKCDQTITNFPNPGDQITTNTAHLSAQASSALPVTNFTVGSGPGTISSLTNLTFSGSGLVSIVASQAGDTNWNAAANVTNTFNVSRATQASLTFSPTSPQTYNTTNGLSAGGGSGTGSISYAVLSGPGQIVGSTNLLVISGTGIVQVSATKAADDIYNSTASTSTVASARAGQTITFPAILDKITTNVVGLSATASSSLSVTNFSVTVGSAQISGLTNLSFTGSGSVSIVASQAGDTNWNAAANVTNTFNVSRATQASLTFSPTSPQTYNTTNGLSAGGGSGTGTISYAVLSGPGQIVGLTNLLVISGTGIVQVSATKAADDIYNSTASTSTVASARARQTITFPAITDQIVTSTVTLSATAGSGLTVSFAVGSGPASISGGNSCTFSATGLVSIIASQAGDTNWNAAPNVTNLFNVIASVFTNLGVPQNVTATDGALTGRVAVTWSAVTGADGYEIWNSDVNNIGTAALLGRPTATNYNDTSDSARVGLMKYYWLRAWNTASTGAFSAVDSGYGLPDAGAEIISGQPAVGDYDDDGKADPAVYHLNSGRLYAWMSSAYYSLVEPAIQFHVDSGEIPAFGDYDGDNYIDAGVFRATSGTWYVWLSSAGYYRVGPVLFGIDANDIPVPVDYDGDGKTDPGVYHGALSTDSMNSLQAGSGQAGSWYIWLSSAGYARLGPLTQFYIGSTDIPVPGDYDGDRLSDPAVYQTAGGTWYVWLSSAGYYQIGPITFATSETHLSVPADYDGDVKCDPAVYSPTEGKWRIWMSGSGYSLTEMELR